MSKPFIWALIIASLIITAAFVVATIFRRQLMAEFRKSLREAQAAGTLPAEFQNMDVETIPLSDIGIELSSSMMRRVEFSDWVFGLWFIWAPLVMICCLGIAFFFRKT